MSPADVKKRFERRLGHVVFGSRKWIETHLARVAADLPPGRVLEIGSGRQDLGTDAYSMRHIFGARHEVLLSDCNPDYGHLVVDVTQMEFDREFDAILCISVLEHVPAFWESGDRLYRALRPGGVLVVSVPMTFPYHDEPGDYWRFTKYGLRRALSAFDDVDIQHRGLARMPITLIAFARRPLDAAQVSEGEGP